MGSTSEDGINWYPRPTKEDFVDKINEIIDFVNEIEPVKHGYWIDNIHYTGFPDPYGTCSICGFAQAISNSLRYCPGCGAKMDGKKII